MTRISPATPEEPGDPPPPEETDSTSVFTRRFLELVSREDVAIRPATQGDGFGVFAVQSEDGTYQMLVAEAKPLFGISRNDKAVAGDIFAEQIRLSLQAGRSSKPGRLARVSPQKLTSFAVLIAGRERAALGTEWRSHLSGEVGTGLPADRQVREAAGFVMAALRYRVQDAADFAWRPVDAVLGSRHLSNLAVLLATVSMAVVFLRNGGLYNFAVNFQNVAAVWAAAYGLIRVGRWWRGVKPPKHEPRRERHQR